LSKRKLGYSHVRLLPKDTGVRPIVNLRTRTPKGLSINQILQSTFQILTYEKVCLCISHQTSSECDRLMVESMPRTLGSVCVWSKRNLHIAETISSGDRASWKYVVSGTEVCKWSPLNAIHRPKLYFVKVDVRAAFDTIDQQKLLEILRRILSEVSMVLLLFGQYSYIYCMQDEYSVRRFARVAPNGQKIRRSFSKRAFPECKHVSRSIFGGLLNTRYI